MKTIDFENFSELHGEDDNGKWMIRIHNDGSQVNIETNDGYSTLYIDTNQFELHAIGTFFTRKAKEVVNGNIQGT